MTRHFSRAARWLAGAAALAVCGVCAVQRLLPPTTGLTPDENAAIVAATAYFDALLAGDLPAAYALTCAKVQDDMTLAEFEAYQPDRDQIRRYELVDVRVSSSGSRLSAVVETEMYLRTRGSFPQNVAVTKESSGWRVCE